MIRRRNLIGVALIAVPALAGCDGRSSREAAAPGAEDSSMIDAPAAPTRTGYAETNGARIYYQVHGDLNSGKTPLLVLHGSYMSAESMAPLVARFAATRPVIAISQRGHGRTGDVAGGITYELLADDAAGVGIMAEAELIARLVTPFLDDAKPVMPPGFFDAPGEKPGGTKP